MNWLIIGSALALGLALEIKIILYFIDKRKG